MSTKAMPVLISNGKHYRVPFRSLLTGSVRERPLYGKRNMSAGCYQDTSIASSRRGRANSTIHTITWSADDDRVLRELKASKISWKRISTVMDDRPIVELKKRWIDIQDDKHKIREVYGSDEVDNDWYLDEEYDREECHVSFSLSPDEDEDTDNDADTFSKPRKTKGVYCIDDEFTLDDVFLLHQIAIDWEKDRPAQAKSVINN